MLNHHLLEERLNAVKEGKPIPKVPVQFNETFQDPTIQPSKSKIVIYKQFFISEGYKLFNVMAASILYGFGLKSLFSADWNLIGTIGVGFLLNHTLSILLKLFKK